jgi:FAD/FMN-containing dehydrogenase
MDSTDNSTKVGILGELIGSVGASVHLPGPDDYIRASNIPRGGNPPGGNLRRQKAAYVVNCRNVDEVRLTVSAARARNLPLSVRGGGQDWVGQPLRQERLVVDLSAMRRVVIDPVTRVATVEGGATVADVINAAKPHGLAAVTGNFSAIGMAGFTLSGGYGSLTPRFGLALDNLLSADVVLEDGSLVTADKTTNGELFWALRGGGGNFGIVVSMRIRLHSIGTVLGGKILFSRRDSHAVLSNFAGFIASAPDELSVVACLVPGHEPEMAVMLVPTWCGDLEAGARAFAQLRSLGNPVSTRVESTTYAEMIAMQDTCIMDGRNYAVETRWLSDLKPDAISTLVASGGSRSGPTGSIMLHHFHGAGTRVPSSATAFGLRRRHFLVEIVASWGAGSEEEARTHRHWARTLASALERDSIPGGYVKPLAPDAYEQVDSAYGCNALRLRRLKKRFDPDGVFSSAIALPV